MQKDGGLHTSSTASTLWCKGCIVPTQGQAMQIRPGTRCHGALIEGDKISDNSVQNYS
jgi:hypothetical protein